MDLLHTLNPCVEETQDDETGRDQGEEPYRIVVDGRVSGLLRPIARLS
jgi:hypothetical protein